MGINGKLLLGNGIWVNPRHLPEEWLTFLNELEGKYGDLFEFDRINGIQSMDVLFWVQAPTQLKIQPGWRRPLIINESSQLDLMRPTPHGPDTNSEEVWAPSYGSFTIQLMEYPEELRTQFINEILSRSYELNEEYPAKDQLTPEESQKLTQLLTMKPYTLLGQFMVYTLD